MLLLNREHYSWRFSNCFYNDLLWKFVLDVCCCHKCYNYCYHKMFLRRHQIYVSKRENATEVCLLCMCRGFFTAFFSYREEAREMFYHAYYAYMENAYPADELMPLSCAGRYRGVSPNRGDIDDSLGKWVLFYLYKWKNSSISCNRQGPQSVPN